MLIGSQTGKKQKTYYAIVLPGVRDRTVRPIASHGAMVLFRDPIEAKKTAAENYGKGTPGYMGKEPAIVELDRIGADDLVRWTAQLTRGVYCLDAEALASADELFELDIDKLLDQGK